MYSVIYAAARCLSVCLVCLSVYHKLGVMAKHEGITNVFGISA